MRQSTWSEAPLVLGLLLVALAAWPRLADPFTSVKWYALEAVAVAWLLSERLLCGSRGLPTAVRRHWVGWAALAAWVVAGSLRQGPAWALAPLVARASFVALAGAAYWSFRRNGLRLAALRGSAAVAAGVVVAIGLAQMAGRLSLPWLAAGDRRSATFGNVNMAAEFLGLALVVLFSRPSPPRGTLRRIGLEALGVGGLAYVALAGTRSVALALVAAFAVLALVRRSAASVARAGAAVAVMTVVLLSPLAPLDAGSQGPAERASKAASARWRLAVWRDTLELVRDHPLGVGPGNFEHAFMPYALAGRSRPGEHLVFRSPHNDYLRLLAEEGVPGAAALLAVLLLLVRDLRRSPAIRAWWPDAGALLASCGAFLAVEAFFQFPFELAFPALLAAVLLGLALAAAEAPGEAGPAAPGAAWPRDTAIVLLGAAIALGMLRLATAEIVSATRHDQPRALERACALDPRRVEACVQAAWLHSVAGDHRAAQGLLEGVLARSPSYLPAIRLLAQDLLAAGDREGGCRYVRLHAALLGEAGPLRTPGEEACVPDPRRP